MRLHQILAFKLLILLLPFTSCGNDRKFRRKLRSKQKISGTDSLPKDIFENLENLVKAQKEKIEQLLEPKDPLKGLLEEKDIEIIPTSDLYVIIDKLNNSYHDTDFESQEYKCLPQNRKNEIRKTNAIIAHNYCTILKHMIKTRQPDQKNHIKKAFENKQKYINLHIGQIGPQPIETEETVDEVRNKNLNIVSKDEDISNPQNQTPERTFQEEQEDANNFIREISPYINLENCFDSLKLFYGYKAVVKTQPLILDIHDYKNIDPDTVSLPDKDSLHYHAHDEVGNIIDYHFRKLLKDHINNETPSFIIQNRQCNITAPRLKPLVIPQIFYNSYFDNEPSLNKYEHPTRNNKCNLSHIDDMIKLSISLLDYFYKDIIMETLRSVEGNANYGSLEQRIKEEGYQLSPQAFYSLKANFNFKDLDNKYYKLLLNVIEIAYLVPNEIQENHQQTIVRNKDQLRRLFGFYPMTEFDILELLKTLKDNRF